MLKNGDGPVVAFRADTDALPLAEDTGVEYASTATGQLDDGTEVPVMHACGHDTHMSAALAAAEIFAGATDAWSGTIVWIFQPGEETAAGAKAMLDDGLWDKAPKPEVVYGQHVMPILAGTINYSVGDAMALADSWKITIHGQGAHASQPQDSTDPIVLGAHMITRIQTVVSREIPPSSFAVLTVGSIQAGSKSNIIPATATLLLNMRTYDEDVRSTMIAALERIVRGECEAAGCPQEPEFRYYDQYPLTDNDDDVNAKVTEALRAQFGDAVFEQSPQTASEDFSIVPSAFGVPYTYWTVGGVSKERLEKAESSDDPADQVAPNHSPFFYPDIDPTLEFGTKAQIAAALAYLG